jgi:hypothetical protein
MKTLEGKKQQSDKGRKWLEISRIGTFSEATSQERQLKVETGQTFAK